jgi:eukaryotic-like serine/threonine-protein kinase
MPRVTNAEIQETRVTSEPLDELPVTPSRRGYGKGDLIDRKYRLEALIGTGGMGEVWTASNDTLGVRRAVKLIRADSDSAESTDRLLHEAQAAARLADPAIVRVFDFGRTEHRDPYIVMELLEGEDLMSIINRRERLSPTKAVRVLLPVVRALGAAHEHGIVHRDLKPENIFLARLPDGRVQPKLLDFGIAKLKNARELRLTSAGSVMGSPLYMAPEQARGEDVDERADIWAVCVVLYEAMTGQPPFHGEDRAQVMHAVATLDPTDPRERGVLEPAPWPIIQHGLEKRRDERWRSMEELGRALARWLLDAGVADDITGASLDAGWFRNSRRSLFASSLPPERSVRALQASKRLWLLWSRRGVAAAHWLQALGLLSWRRFERLEKKQRAALIALSAVLVCAWLLLAGRSPTAAPATAALADASNAPAASPAPAAAVPAAAPPSPAVPAAPVAAEPSGEPKPEPATAAPARNATASARNARASKPRRAPARKPASPANEALPRETVTRARRAKLIDPYK